jgi:hypothetical protein
LTFVSKTPERPGLLRHHPFETLADWMIAKMLPDHIEHFAPWLVATPPDVSTARTENSRRTGTLQIADVQPDHLPALNEVNRLGNSVRYEPQAGPMIGGQDNHRQPPTGEILLIADILVASEQNVEPRLLRRIKQLAVCQSLPRDLIRTRYLMSSQTLS